MRNPINLLTAALAGLLLALGTSQTARADLQSYLDRPEPDSYWEVARSQKKGGMEVIDIDLTSQKWHGILWKHRLRVFVPKKSAHPDISLLLITGGNGRGSESQMIGQLLAKETGAKVAILSGIPAQPLFDGLKEDALIAHTFVKFYETGDETWPLLFPMTKAAIKAMDAVEELSALRWETKVERFVVTGASKRGWTTWLTAAMDDRVAGMIPLVFDNLNFQVQMKHQIESWGKFSHKIHDYTDRGLQKLMSTEKGKKLVDLVDPWVLRNDRLARVPKLLINGTNDQYWTVDALNHYWDGLEGENSLLYAPNSGHGLEDRDRVMRSAAAFLRHVARGKSMPSLTWKHFDSDGLPSLRLNPSRAPARVRVWVAQSETRDFRKARWEEVEARRDGKTFHFDLEPPQDGFTAFFGEADYGKGSKTFSLSTAIRVVEARREPPAAKRAYY